MRILSKAEMELAAGGSDPKMVCVADPATETTSGNTTVKTSGNNCQSSSGLTIIKSVETTTAVAAGGLSGLMHRVFEGTVEGSWVNTKETTTMCDSKNNCHTEVKESNPQHKGSDLDDGSEYESFAGGGDAAGCVQIASRLPCGTFAGDILVGSQMQLSDQVSLEAGVGIVSFSKRKKAQGYRLTTASGVSLVCSSTAPIPTTEGLMLAPNVLGKSVAVRKDEDVLTHTAWDAVVSVEKVGEIEVQHITVGDKCFWAGEKPNSYILHHNMKNAVNIGPDSYAGETDLDDWA